MRYRFLPGVSRAIPAVVATAAAAAACGDAGPARSAWEATRDTLGDTITVRTVEGSVWGDVELAEEVRIGRLDGPDEYTFGEITAVTAGPDGTVYVLDRQGPTLRAYTPDGVYLRDLGRAGEGPGELKNPDSGLSLLPDGRILVRDPGNARITVFTPDGEHDAEWRIRGGNYTSTPLFIDRAGGAYQQLFEFTDGASVISFVRYGPDGVPGDTLVIPPAEDQPLLIAEHAGPSGRSRSTTNVPFWPVRATTLSLDGKLVVGDPRGYSIDLPTADGVLRIQRAFDPAPVLPEEAANLRDRTTHDMRSTEPGWSWDGPAIPDVKPAFRALWLDDDGRLWVQLYSRAEPIPPEEIEEPDPGSDERPPLRWRERTRFDVFDADGVYLGQVSAPHGFATYPRPTVRGERMWAVVRDVLDVPYLVRYRIVPEPDGP